MKSLRTVTDKKGVPIAMLKIQEIRELIKLIDESSITEFKYETEEDEVFLKKGSGEQTVVQQTTTAAPAQSTTEPQPQPTVQNQAQPQTNTVDEKEADTDQEQSSDVSDESAVDYDHEITSPMVGTFYAAPSPEDDPYVQKGDKVQKNSVVCIVEAMKLFNEIEAEVEGEIVDILVEDGELVEYGQPLFRIKNA